MKKCELAVPWSVPLDWFSFGRRPNSAAQVDDHLALQPVGQLLQEATMDARLVHVGIKAAQRKMDDRDARVAGNELRRRLHLIAEAGLRKGGLEGVLRVDLAGGLHHIAFHREDVPERAIALVAHRVGELGLAQEVLGIVHRDGARAQTGERPHVGPAHHHAIGGEGAWHGLRFECARQPAFIQILITA
jgi:hypothetical protein